MISNNIKNVMIRTVNIISAPYTITRVGSLSTDHDQFKALLTIFLIAIYLQHHHTHSLGGFGFCCTGAGLAAAASTALSSSPSLES